MLPISSLQGAGLASKGTSTKKGTSPSLGSRGTSTKKGISPSLVSKGTSTKKGTSPSLGPKGTSTNNGISPQSRVKSGRSTTIEEQEVENDIKRAKLSTTADNDNIFEDLEGIDWDSWNEDEEITDDTNSGETKTDSNSSYNTAFTSLSNKTDKQSIVEQYEPTPGSSRKRNLCRVIGLKSKAANTVSYRAHDMTNDCEVTLQLHDIWVQQELPQECLVNIVDVELDSEKKYTVARTKGYLIVEPDSLVSVSLVTHQLWCDREAVFKNILRLFEGSRDTLRGNICHELLAKALLHNTRAITKAHVLLEEILKSSAVLHQAYELKLNQEELETLGAELLPYIIKFTKTRILSTAKDQAWEIHKVRDIEDMYWNPVFGMKGKLDATIDVRKADGTLATIPMEVKTGNPAFEGKKKIRDIHVGQLSLYSLLMSSRYKDVTEGLLYYVREDHWQECSIKQFNLQALVVMRNNLVINSSSSVGTYKSLPKPTVDFGFKCGKCEYKQVCSLLIRNEYPNIEPEDQTKSVTELQLLSATPYLQDEDVQYFQKWFSFITMEVEASEKPKHLTNLWNLTPEERCHTCIAGLKLVKCWIPKTNTANGRQYNAKFEATDTVSNVTLVDIKQSDFLIIGTSDEVCVSNCVVETVTSDPFSITVSLESDLNGKSRNGLYNLDKISCYNPMFTNYVYLARLMEDTPRMQRLRDYMIHKKLSVIRPIKRNSLTESEGLLSKYNKDQQRVILKSLATDSFLFVKGMPGTGKTETIVGLLQMLVNQGKTVLLAAYTSSAVDNVLLKYKAFSTNFIRMGREFYVRDELQPFSYHAAISGITNVDKLRAALNKPPIIATTLMSLSHEIFANRSFDYAILDEISQSLPVTCIGALCKADKYILFGDPDQLPPVIVSPQARFLGGGETLFSAMSGVVNTAKLTIQYRMNGTIMALANKLTYNNQMTCFSRELEGSYLNLPTDNLKAYISAITVRPRQVWLSYVASKKLVRSVIFLDTSNINAPDSYKNHSVKNNMEVAIATECLKLFLDCGLDASEVGLIAPYTAQVQALRSARNRLGMTDVGENCVEVNTVDQYQGRDKTVIICSLTKTRGAVDTGDKNGNADNLSDAKKTSILDDKKRLNVAITRAKRKLILIGHMESLKSFEPLKDLFEILLPEQVIHLEPQDVERLEEIHTPLKTLY